MQVPEQVLAARMPSGAKAVLTAMWRAADSEPPWIASTQKDLAEATGLSLRTVRRWLAFLRSRGATRPEGHEVLGRRISGHALARVFARDPAALHRPALTSATAGAGLDVATKREQTHTCTAAIETPKRRARAVGRVRCDPPPADAAPPVDDAAQICKHARRGDSHVQICERLLKARAPCSEGTWHKVKVFRRIARMAEQLGVQGRRLAAGEIVNRWKMTRG